MTLSRFPAAISLATQTTLDMGRVIPLMIKIASTVPTIIATRPSTRINCLVPDIASLEARALTSSSARMSPV